MSMIIFNRTTNDKKHVTENPTRSPDSIGRQNTNAFRIARTSIGRMILNAKYNGFRSIVNVKVIVGSVSEFEAEVSVLV
jgi:hypothetical protein